MFSVLQAPIQCPCRPAVNEAPQADRRPRGCVPHSTPILSKFRESLRRRGMFSLVEDSLRAHRTLQKLNILTAGRQISHGEAQLCRPGWPAAPPFPRAFTICSLLYTTRWTLSIISYIFSPSTQAHRAQSRARKSQMMNGKRRKCATSCHFGPFPTRALTLASCPCRPCPLLPPRPPVCARAAQTVVRHAREPPVRRERRRRGRPPHPDAARYPHRHPRGRARVPPVHRRAPFVFIPLMTSLTMASRTALTPDVDRQPRPSPITCAPAVSNANSYTDTR